MSNQSYVSGSVTVGTTPTLIASPSGPSGILISNGTTAVVLGDSAVTTTTGYSVAASATNVLIPTKGVAHDLYGIVATGTTTVSFIYPA